MGSRDPQQSLIKVYISGKVILKNPAYGQHSVLLYVCDQGVPILYHQSEQIQWVGSIP